MRVSSIGSTALLAAVLAAPPSFAGEESPGTLHCQLIIDLTGRAARYRTIRGNGAVQCDAGQGTTVEVLARTPGNRLEKGRTVQVRADFSPVAEFEDVFGRYDRPEPALDGRESPREALTKESISLELHGVKQGLDLDRDLSWIQITPAVRPYPHRHGRAAPRSRPVSPPARNPPR